MAVLLQDTGFWPALAGVLLFTTLFFAYRAREWKRRYAGRDVDAKTYSGRIEELLPFAPRERDRV